MANNQEIINKIQNELIRLNVCNVDVEVFYDNDFENYFFYPKYLKNKIEHELYILGDNGYCPDIAVRVKADLIDKITSSYEA